MYQYTREDETTIDFALVVCAPLYPPHHPLLSQRWFCQKKTQNDVRTIHRIIPGHFYSYILVQKYHDYASAIVPRKTQAMVILWFTANYGFMPYRFHLNRYRQQQKLPGGENHPKSLPPTTKITPGGKSPKSLLPTKNIYIYRGGKKNREAAFSPKKTKTGVHVPGRQNTVQVKCTTVQRVLCAQTVRLCGLLTGRQAFTYFLPRVLLPCILLFCCFLDLATAGHPRANKTPKHTSRVWCSSS